MHSLNFFIHIVETHLYWGYVILFLAMLIEGELFLIAAGMMVSLHAFDLFDAYFFALAGVLTGDVLWYSAGRYLEHNHSENKYLSSVINRVLKSLPGIKKNPFRMIFLSKFIYGLNHSTILVLGYIKIEFMHFFKIQVLTSFLWTVIFFTIGYVSGEAALALTHRFDRLVMLTVFFLLSLLIAGRIIARVIEKRQPKN